MNKSNNNLLIHKSNNKENIFITKKTDNEYLFSSLKVLDSSSFSNLFNSTRMEIISLLSKKALYPSEIAKKLNIHEQNVYYHIKPLIDNNILLIKDKKEIRGTVAKRFYCPITNFALINNDEIKNWVTIQFHEKNSKLNLFFDPLLSNTSFNGSFVVGSPDPHGEFKAYSRDGHYAIDLALCLGKSVSLPNPFSVKLDVDIKNDDLNNNLLLIGGPVTNTVVSLINDNLPVKFTYSKLWGLKSKKTNKVYIDDTIGLIAKIENPFNSNSSLFVLAGIRSIGTKSCVLALTRFSDRLLSTYSGQKRWYAIVQGFDLDGDGKIDNIEVLE
jgi:DNA-binding transcriptional ArsR family regulator